MSSKNNFANTSALIGMQNQGLNVILNSTASVNSGQLAKVFKKLDFV